MLAEPPAPGSCANEDIRQAQHTDSYLPDCRAMELVNQPDKGNQNVQSHIGDREPGDDSLTGRRRCGR
jgi:hypothetical protein